MRQLISVALFSVCLFGLTAVAGKAIYDAALSQMQLIAEHYPKPPQK